ncbi:MAG: glycosyltransferase [Verrucomicrobiaceae bacterium]|nr:glycosyltransferase [Verrucomicrobiaceae bacterium]
MPSVPPPAPLGRVLLVSHNFPPTQGPESALVRINTLDLLQRGWRVSVLTTEMEHFHQTIDHGMLAGLPAELEVIRTPSYDATLRKRWGRFGTLIIILLRNWLVPEVFFLWLLSSVPAGKRWLRHNGPAIIYSRATKHVSNVAGWMLKKATGLPWIAHFSDPWQASSYLNPFQTWIAEWLERRIFRDADAIIIVNGNLYGSFAAIHPVAKDKIHVIPHGYEPLEHPPAPSENVGRRPMQAIHAGSFIPDTREPDVLFQGLALLNKRLPLQGLLQLTCVGADTTRYQAMADELGVGGFVSLLESIPYQQCQDMVARSDLLMVLDTPDQGGIYLPTKLIEYLPYDKPVLGVAEKGSAVHRVLEHCDLNFADQHSPEDIANVFEGLLRQWQAGTWSVSALTRERVLDYRIDRVNGKLHELLTQLSRTLPA